MNDVLISESKDAIEVNMFFYNSLIKKSITEKTMLNINPVRVVMIHNKSKYT